MFQNRINPVQYCLLLLLFISIIIDSSIIPHQKSQTQIRLFFNIGTLSRKKRIRLNKHFLIQPAKSVGIDRLTVHTKIHQLMSCMLKLKSTGS
ncbi:unknown [Bacteroides uniformis CAG:3]|nr:unknown [Bacteroides uniformis CAG:3]